jgi:hypothetical protein
VFLSVLMETVVPTVVAGNIVKLNVFIGAEK